MEKLQISLAAARVNAELTQSQVAEIMNVDRSTIRRWEKNKKVPNFDEIKKLSEVYHIPIDCIFFWQTNSLKARIAKARRRECEIR